jgi:GntR family transcriptional regulator
MEVDRKNGVPATYSANVISENLLRVVLKEQTFRESLFALMSSSRHPVSHAESLITPTLLTKQELPELQSELAYFLLFEDVN